MAVLRASGLGEQFAEWAVEVYPVSYVVVRILGLGVCRHGPLGVADILDLEGIGRRFIGVEVV